MTGKVGVLLVDDHNVVLDALTARLDLEPGLEVVGRATTAEGAMIAMRHLRPDVITVDVALGEDDGLALVRTLREHAPVVVVTAYAEPDTALAAVRAGAAGFVAKTSPTKVLIDALRGAAVGEVHLPPHVLGHVLERLLVAPKVDPIEERLARLTDREHEILLLMAAGMDRPAIARHLVLSMNTVRTHSRKILAKLEVHSSLEAVSIAHKAGLRPPASSELPSRRGPGA